MLHIRQVGEASKPVVEAMYERRVRYNNAHNIHQWSPNEVSWEAFSKLHPIANYYAGTVSKKVVCGLFIVDEDTLYWPGMEKGAPLYLHKTCVNPAYSGDGYTDAMIQYFVEKGRRESYSGARLDVCEHKDKLRRVYE